MPLLLRKTSSRRPFRDTNFCYWLGRDRLYSPARVFRDLGLEPKYSDVDPVAMRKAACRGKLSETYCLKVLKGERVFTRQRNTGSLYDDVTARVQAFKRWCDDAKPELVSYHRLVWSGEDRICWETDFQVKLDGQLTLIDLKCTAQAAKHWPLLIGCGLSYDMECERGGILQINPKMNKQGYKWREYDRWKVLDQWERTVAKWHADRDFKRLRAELGFDSEAVGFEVEDELMEYA